MKIRLLNDTDIVETIKLIAEFRSTLSSFKNNNNGINIDSAKEELVEYQLKGYPIYVAECDSKIVGYLVCRIEGEVVWAESLYVLTKYRNKGIGSSLYTKAEEIAESLGSETVYNWIHPNNEKVIQFLNKQGYSVLNLIEIRKKRKDEVLTKKIKVDGHIYDY